MHPEPGAKEMAAARAGLSPRAVELAKSQVSQNADSPLRGAWVTGVAQNKKMAL